MSVLTVCLSPGFQRSVLLERLQVGEVNRLHTVHVDVSGKAVNVCRVLHALGVASVCIGQGGANAFELLRLAQAEGLDLRLVGGNGFLRTCTSIIETSRESTRQVTELVEPSPTVDTATVELVREAILAGLGKAEILVVSGSMAPGFPSNFQSNLVALGRQAGIPVLVDLQGQALRDCLAQGPGLVKINLAEFAATFLGDRFMVAEHQGLLAADRLGDEVLTAVTDVSGQHDCIFILTRGPRSVLVARGSRIIEVPVQALPGDQVVSPIGSGDAFMAGLVVSLLRTDVPAGWKNLGFDHLETAVSFASACAAANARTARPGFLDESFIQSL